MKINVDNYEAWFLDYVEGNLTNEQLSQLEDFLEDRPELQVELDEFEMIMLDDVSLSFPDKNRLLKSESVKVSFEDYIAFYEGDLDEVQEKIVLDYVANDKQAKKDFDYFGKTYLQPDPSITFDSRAALIKKETRIIALYWRQIAVAASLLLAIGLWLNSGDPTENVLADDNDIESQDSVADTIKDSPMYNFAPNDKQVAAYEAHNESVIENEIHHTGDDINKSEGRIVIAPQQNQGQSTTKRIDKIENIAAIQIQKIDRQTSESLAIISDSRSIEYNVESVTIEDESIDQAVENEPLTAIAYVEREVATAIMGEEKKKLKVFDVLKKIGDKSNLYTLSGSKNDKFELSVAGAKVKGNKGVSNLP